MPEAIMMIVVAGVVFFAVGRFVCFVALGLAHYFIADPMRIVAALGILTTVVIVIFVMDKIIPTSEEAARPFPFLGYCQVCGEALVEFDGYGPSCNHWTIGCPNGCSDY